MAVAMVEVRSRARVRVRVNRVRVSMLVATSPGACGPCAGPQGHVVHVLPPQGHVIRVLVLRSMWSMCWFPGACDPCAGPQEHAVHVLVTTYAPREVEDDPTDIATQASPSDGNWPPTPCEEQPRNQALTLTLPPTRRRL